LARILHISDIHIRISTRHEEFSQVFNNLKEKVGESNPDEIVVCGDVFHSKNRLSPESITLAKTLFTYLGDVAPVRVIVGNHDVNLANPNRMDSISPIIESVDGKTKFPIVYYKESGLYEVGKNLVYGVFSLLDKDNYPLLDGRKKNKDKVYIALYHGIVDNPQTETGFVLLNSELGSSSFKNYDYALLGDIHKRQFLNKERTIGYSGSLIQSNYAESTEKGYLLWNTDSGLCEFVRVNNPHIYKSIYISSSNPLDDINLNGKDFGTLSLRLIFERQYSPVQITEAIEYVKGNLNPQNLIRFLFPKRGMKMKGLRK